MLSPYLAAFNTVLRKTPLFTHPESIQKKALPPLPPICPWGGAKRESTNVVEPTCSWRATPLPPQHSRSHPVQGNLGEKPYKIHQILSSNVWVNSTVLRESMVKRHKMYS